MTTLLTKEEPCKHDAATQQIAGQRAVEAWCDLHLAGLTRDDKSKQGIEILQHYILSAIERGIQAFLCDTSNPSGESSEPGAPFPSIPQPSKARKEQALRAQGSPASGERSEPKIGDWVKTSLDSEYSYEVADLRQFPHGLMIGIYDEPPSKHIDYWNPSNLYATAHHSEPRGQRQEWALALSLVPDRDTRKALEAAHNAELEEYKYKAWMYDQLCK